MEKKNAIILLLILVFLTISLTMLTYSFFVIVDVKNVEMQVIVKSGRVGINLDTDKLWFGMISPGSSASREIELTNNKDYELETVLKPSGEIGDYVSFSENPAILKPHELKKVRVMLSLPETIAYGNYTGNLRIIFKRKL